MDIPPSRKREFDEKEVTFIKEAILNSGLDEEFITLAWGRHSVDFNRVVEIQPVLFDCRGQLDTPCWIVHRAPASEGSKVCACGELVREAADGAYGSLKAAVAAAIGETVRATVLANIPDSPQTILKERPAGQPTPCNDFITHCVHP
jgi:hypothetical protein